MQGSVKYGEGCQGAVWRGDVWSGAERYGLMSKSGRYLLSIRTMRALIYLWRAYCGVGGWVTPVRVVMQSVYNAGRSYTVKSAVIDLDELVELKLAKRKVFGVEILYSISRMGESFCKSLEEIDCRLRV